MKSEINLISVVLLGALFSSAAIATEDFKPFSAVLSENAPMNKTSDLSNPAILQCVPSLGTKVKVLAQASQLGLPQFVSKVEVIEGQCKSTVGWVVTSRINAASN